MKRYLPDANIISELRRRWVFVLLGCTALAGGAGIWAAARGASHRVAHLATRRSALAARSKGAPQQIVLWAWERPEHFEHFDHGGAGGFGVAFLARTMALARDSVSVRPRLQPLTVAPGTPLTAVVRIETNATTRPTLSEGQAQQTAAAIAELAQFPGISALQVDFDATLSQRRFYRSLLHDLRAQMPKSMPLSITALASWCSDDPWIADLPIDDAIPMLFRMGPDRRLIQARLENGGDFGPAVCKHSLGLSTDEPLARVPLGRKLYVFRTGGWNAAAVQEVMEEASYEK